MHTSFNSDMHPSLIMKAYSISNKEKINHVFPAQDVVLALVSLLGGLEYKDQQAAATKALQKC